MSDEDKLTHTKAIFRYALWTNRKSSHTKLSLMNHARVAHPPTREVEKRDEERYQCDSMCEFSPFTPSGSFFFIIEAYKQLNVGYTCWNNIYKMIVISYFRLQFNYEYQRLNIDLTSKKKLFNFVAQLKNRIFFMQS